MQFRHIFLFAKKDWQLFWADPRAAALCFVVPILLASLFGLIFDRPNRADEATRLPVMLIVDDVNESSELVEHFRASPRLEVHVVNPAEANRRLADRRPGVAVVLPRNWDAGETRPRITILHHPQCVHESHWAEGVTTEIAMRWWATRKLGPTLGEAAVRLPFDCTIQVVEGDRARFNSYSHSFSGMTIQYLLFWGMESGLILLRERGRGVWARLRVSPAPFGAILFGRALATATIAGLQVVSTFAFGYFAFGVTVHGSWWGFVGMVLSLCAFTAAVGLLVAALGGNENRGRNLSVLAILCISMLGGLWLPAFLLPVWLRDLSLFLPTTWAMRGLDATTWQGRSFWDVVPHILILLVFASVFLAIAWLRFVRLDRAQPVTAVPRG